ncbi:SRPBCC family protein [Streptomyces sp. NPDC040750]|uniref:SRPBCC family protein n=1 Tax=Streptomyces sp. NPDC040750 TaxID=3154491 RepID=UPI0033C075CF
MSQVEESVRVDVPVRTAYNQWTQFETFPAFMEGVERIEQRSDTLTHWVTSIGGVRREFDATITEQRPDERVAWTTVDGTARQAGVVTFHRIDDSATKVMLQLDFEPEGVTETVGDKLGLVKRRVSGDLRRFKEFIEDRGGRETGAWRGEVGGSTGGGAF